MLFIRIAAVSLLLASMAVEASAQDRAYMVGRLLNSSNRDAVMAAHVMNFHDSVATISDRDGLFRVPAHIGDTLLISCIGYHDKAHAVSAADLLPEIRDVRLDPRSYQLGEVKVLPFGTYEQFRERFKTLQVTDSTINIVGVRRPRLPDVPMMETDAYWKKAGTILRSPVSSLYHNLSRKEQGRREYLRLMQESVQTDARRRKYSDARLGDITGLEDNELHIFLDTIRWNEDNFARNTDYQVISYLLSRLAEYKQGEKP